MGVQSVEYINKEFDQTLENWLESGSVVRLNQAADTDKLADNIVRFASLFHRKRNLLFK